MLQLQDLNQLYGQEFHIRQIPQRLKGSPRNRQILKRFQLDANNGKILDEHDQFYRDHKLLLVLFRALGVMPIERGRIGRITFSWTSSAMYYAYFFYTITTILVLLVGYQRFHILTTESKQFDEYIYSIIFIVYLVPHFWIPFVGWGVAHEVCDYKNSWTRFQLNYYKITGRDLEFPLLSTLIITISIGCLVVAVAFLLTLSVLLEGFTLYHTTAYLHIITMINMNCALWYINCRAIGNASIALAQSFLTDIDDSCQAHIVAHYRTLWLSLSELLQKLGNAYARTYATYSLFMITNITIGIYGFTAEIIDHGLRLTFKELGLLVDATYCFGLLYVFCDCSHRTSKIIAHKVQTVLMTLKLSEFNVETRKEIGFFLQAIKMNPPLVSLRGYTVVNRELITSSITTMAIYLIVLLQFKISLVNLKH